MVSELIVSIKFEDDENNTFFLILFYSVSVQSQDRVYPTTLTVAKEGKADYRCIQDAVNAVRAYSPQHITIFIKNGIYNEKVLMPLGLPMFPSLVRARIVPLFLSPTILLNLFQQILSIIKSDSALLILIPSVYKEMILPLKIFAFKIQQAE